MRRFLAIAALPLAALAGCAQPTGPGATPGTAPPGFQCPPPGTVVQTPARTFQYTGASPSDPFTCIAVNPATGESTGYLANLEPSPWVDQRTVRAGMARLFPLEVGSNTYFLYEMSTADGRLINFNSSWRVMGQQTMDIAGQPRNVLVMEHTNTTARPGYGVRWIYYYDTQARALVGGDPTILQGYSDVTPWRAVGITVP
ncbi:hypothetical protein [Roseomonas sp. AR75]|uniref:hypothetical protein n=1 Tax=Roseomonas sp. AR75 TaxID=2562311 RepID=UPI0010C13815|nr:hypothetical protein [Roseomonas sp. AR75]